MACPTNSLLELFLKNSPTKSIIALDGDLPDKNFFKKFNHLPIFAADGGSNSLPTLPQAIVGDLDSIHANKIPNSIQLIRDPDQNYGDFEKTVRYAASKKALPTLVLGVNGGYLDHILNNIALLFDFAKKYENFTNSILYSPPIAGQILNPGHYTYHLPINTKISLFGVDALISTEGLKWELDQISLHFPLSSSTSNRIISDSLKITLHRGFILLLIYLQDIQDMSSC